MRVCSVEGCEEKHQARGMCRKHYNFLQEQGVVGSLNPCSIQSCTNKTTRKLYCNKHYVRLYRYGSPYTIHVPQTKHGMSKTSLYKIWSGMKSRCLNSNHPAYPDYGGRGIKVCERWVNGTEEKSGFECFYEDIGERSSSEHSIDRIDVNGNYEPKNCRWATQKEQVWNQRRSHCETCSCLKNGQLAKWKLEAVQKAQLSLV